LSRFQHIAIGDEGRLLAEADVQVNVDLLVAQLRVEAGHLPSGSTAT